MSDRAIQLLKDLIKIDSVNPSLVLGAAGEDAIARTLTSAMQGMGMTVRTQIVAPGRPLNGSRTKRSAVSSGRWW